MRNAILVLILFALASVARAQPSSLVEVTDTSWSGFGLQVYAAGTDTAWVMEGRQDTMWYVKWQGRHLLSCGQMQAPFDLETLPEEARAVLRGRKGGGDNDPLGRKYHCITSFGALR